ncbi:MAG: DUF2306 domain-containing protein [Gammaproteobacteria bacterium]|nr:DUF2306 domain-containing protein [Gammaproteobacteria bacterium]
MTTTSFELPQGPKRHMAMSGLFILGALLAGLVAIYGITFPILLPGMSDEFHHRYLNMSLFLVSMHVVGSGIALLISPLQLVIYRRNRTLHRYLGRVYFLAVIAGSIGGYYMAWHAFGGFISTLGLSILATLWWSFTLLAVIYARVGNVAAHRRWMLRSFALTYAAVTLRLMAPALSLYLDEVTQSQVVYWLSWILNLALVQIWIRKF